MGHSRGTRKRTAATALLALVLALVAAGCGLGDKAALEERITDAPGRLDGRVVRGTISVESRFVSAPTAGGIGGFGAPGVGGDQSGFEIPEGGVPIGTESRAFVLDLATSRATLAAADESGLSVLFDDLVLYGRRGGIPADDARPWVRLDLDDVDKSAGRLEPFGGDAADAVVAFHPAVLADLVAGTLTGSIEVVGPETIDGVETTHYAVNIALDKAIADVRRARYPEDRRELVERLIELLGIDGDVHPADVWLDTDGNIRRFSVALVQRPIAKVEFALVVTLDITEIGGTYDAVPPTPQEVLSVDSVVRFISTVTGGSAEDDAIPPSVAATLGTVPTAPDDPAASAEADDPSQPGDPTEAGA